MAKITLSNIVSGFASTSLLDTNFQAIEDELNNKVLYRNNPAGQANQMLNDLDMNSNDILNVGTITTTELTVAGSSVAASAAASAASAAAALVSETNAAASKSASATSETNAAASAAAASASETAAALSKTNAATSETNSAASALAASTSETNAAASAVTASTAATNALASETAAALSETNSATSETNAAASAASAAASYDSFDDRYLGAKASNPALDNDGDALVDGALFYDTTAGSMKVYDTGSGLWSVINSYAHPNHTGDVTSIQDGATTITAAAVTNTKLADVATSTVKGRVTAGTGSPEDLTISQVQTLIGGTGLDADTVDSFEAIDLKAGRKNAIINGSFDVWQRGTSGFTGNVYTADRWRITNVSTGLTVNRATLSQTEAEAFNFLYGLEMVAVSSAATVSQRIENPLQFKGKTITISFLAKSTTSSSLNVQLQSVSATNGAGTVSSDSVSLTTSLAAYSVTLSDVDFSQFVAASEYANAGSYFSITLDPTDATGTVTITGVQIELGSVATDFEPRTLGEELALCLRYYHIIAAGTTLVPLGTGRINSANDLVADIALRQEMRATPTFTYSTLGHFVIQVLGGTSETPVSAMSYVGNNQRGYVLAPGTTSTANSFGLLISNNAAAELRFDAEL